MREPEVSIPSAAELHARALASLETPTPWETAFHEAGHVVVSITHKTWPRFVHLSDEPSSDAAGRTCAMGFSGLTSPAQSVGSGDEAAVLADRRVHYCEVCLAGKLAEQTAVGCVVDVQDLAFGFLDEEFDEGAAGSTGDDARTVRQLVAVHGLDEWAADAFVQEAAAGAHEILLERWDHVRLVAAALINRRHLDEEDLRSLLHPV